MLQPALLGGVAIGVLSALPVINLANCCCAWILFGGGLAAYLLQQQRPTPISAGDGALVGLMAGGIGGVVWTLVSIPINAMLMPIQAGFIERALASGDVPPEVRGFLEGLQGGAAAGVGTIVGGCIAVFVCAVFAMIGGLFGAIVFRKNLPPPPPEPSFTPPAFPPSSFSPPPIPPSTE